MFGAVATQAARVLNGSPALTAAASLRHLHGVSDLRCSILNCASFPPAARL